jgi:beta-galactosidase
MSWIYRLLAAGAACALMTVSGFAQTPHTTTLSDGAILHNGRPFPMVLDAGTDCFTPQDFDTVMASKDAWGANTWWLQYAMRHMKSETEGDFSGLTRSLDFFEKAGMMVNLYVRGEYRDVPAWFYEKYSDYKLVDPNGKQIDGQICFQHEGFRRLIDNYVRGVARAARNKKALLMYSTYDEFGPRGWGCFCSRCVRKYREYLKTKYGDTASLNRAWKSGYASFDEIDAPRTQSFDANFGDWQRYRVGVARDFGLLYYNALKQEDPDHLRWIDINMDGFDYTWKWGVIWTKLTDMFDVLNFGPEGYEGNAPSRTAMSRAIRDNYGKATTWHLGFPRGEVNPRNELYSRLFESNHGGLVWWYSFWDVLRDGHAWGAGEKEGSPLTGNWYAARELNHLTRYLDDLYVYSRPVRGEVGIFVSNITDMTRSLIPKQALQSEDPTDLDGVIQIVRDLNIPHEAITEDQIDKLKSFRVVFLAQAAMCTDEKTAHAFREYVRGGGTLVVTRYALSCDENGRELAEPAFGLDQVWGSTGAEGQAPDGRIASAAGPLPTLGGVARRKVATARVLASLADGTPAITLNRYGKGQVLYIGTNAGEVYNTGYLLTRGQYRLKPDQKLDMPRYQELLRQYDGWRNYAVFLRDFLKSSGVASPVTAVAQDQADLSGKVRVSVQEQKSPERRSSNHLLVVTLEPVYDAAAQISTGAAKVSQPPLGDLSIRVRLPAPEQVKAVYRIPPIGYQLGKIDAVPEKLGFQASNGEIRIVLPKPSEAECLLIARDARPLVGIRSDAVSAKEGRATPVLVTVDNATGGPISGEIVFPEGFRATETVAGGSRFSGLEPGERYTARFAVTAPSPIERNRTFAATVRYRRADGETGQAASYPVTSRTDERLAWGWLQQVESGMTQAATTRGTPHGALYEEALQKREFVYAAYNSGEYADTIRLAREALDVLTRLRPVSQTEPRP